MLCSFSAELGHDITRLRLVGTQQLFCDMIYARRDGFDGRGNKKG
jgi:hypothetical protein